MSIALSLQLSHPVAAAAPSVKPPQTAQNSTTDAAEKTFNEGVQLYKQGTAEARKGAIAFFEEALKLYREAGDRNGEALTLNNIGLVPPSIVFSTALPSSG